MGPPLQLQLLQFIFKGVNSVSSLFIYLINTCYIGIYIRKTEILHTSEKKLKQLKLKPKSYLRTPKISDKQMKYNITRPTAPAMPKLGKGTECIQILLFKA